LSLSRRAAASISLGFGSYLASGDSRRSGTGRPEEATDDDGCGLTRSCCCCCWTFLTVVWTAAEAPGSNKEPGDVARTAAATTTTVMPSIKAGKEPPPCRRRSGTTTTPVPATSFPALLIICQSKPSTRNQ